MVKLSRILRDYSDAGGLNTLLAPWGFVEDGALLTKAGHMARSYAVRGIDVDQQAALAACRDRHVAADQEGEPAEHLLLRQPDLAVEQLADAIGELFVVGHDAILDRAADARRRR